MKLVHVIRGVDPVGGGVRPDHFGRELKIDYVNAFVAFEAELSPRNMHNKGKPFSVCPVAENRGFAVFAERVVRLRAVDIKTE